VDRDSETYNADKAGHMEPDGVSDSGGRPWHLNKNSITSRHVPTNAVDMAVDSKQKVVRYLTPVTCPAILVSHTSTTTVNK